MVLSRKPINVNFRKNGYVFHNDQGFSSGNPNPIVYSKAYN